MKPWIIYTRVSTDEQAKEGVSLEAQRRSCEAMLLAQQITTFEVVVDDGYSGKSLKRPGLSGIMRRCERSEVAGVCVYALDRLTRSRRDIHQIVDALGKGNADLVGVRDKIDTTGPSGRFMLHMLANLANLEIEQTGERVRQSFRLIKSQGGYCHKPPAGCVLVRGTDRIPRLEQHPQQGPLVAAIWPMLAQDHPLSEVVTYLNGKVPTRNGKPWTKAAVHYLATNRNVIGVLVDEDGFAAALARLSARNQGKRKDLTAPAIVVAGQTSLAGLCYCQGCGSALVQVTCKRESGSYVYLRCSGRLKRGPSFCASGDVPAKAVEDIIFSNIRTWIADGTITRLLADWYSTRCQHLGAALAQIPDLKRSRDAIKKRATMLMEVIEEGGGIISPKIARERLVGLQAQVDAIEAQLEGLRSAEETVGQHREVAERMPDYLSKAMARIDGATIDQRRDILHGIIDKITIDRETGATVQLAITGPSCEGSSSYSCQEWLPRLDSNQE